LLGEFRGEGGVMTTRRSLPLRITFFHLLVATATLAFLPVATMPVGTAPGVVPLFVAAVFATEVATSYLLFTSFEADRQWDQLLLASAYLYSALMAVVHVLTFPGALVAEVPVIGAPPQGAAWIFLLWILLFPALCLTAVTIAVASPRPAPEASTRGLVCGAAGATVAVVLLAAVACVLLGGSLPALLAGARWTALNFGSTMLAVLCCAAAITLVYLRLRRSELYLWLAMALTGVACANVLAAAAGGRYTLGWSLGRLIWAISGSVLLIYFLGHHVRQRHALTRANELLGREARETAAELAAIVSSSSDAILSKSPQGIVTSWNEAAAQLLGYGASEIIGRSIREIIPEDRQAEEDRILASINEGVRIENYETERIHKSGHVVEVSITVSPLHAGERLIGASSIMHDIGLRKRRERHAALLLREVNHRSKNMLAIVQAVARQTAADDPEHFLSSFIDRLGAISANHDLLVESEWRGVDLGDLARAELAAVRELIGTRIHLGGPALRVTGAAGQAIGMAIHELATNSGKYGALSSHAGTVGLEWSIVGEGDGPRLRLAWSETGGPAVSPPSRRGFGTVLIVDVPRSVLNATVDLEYPSSGVRWMVDAPLDTIAEKDGADLQHVNGPSMLPTN
jgi:PAS domain S-box-containing protein